MGNESASKTVKGLGIATLVISILSIIALVASMAFVGVITNYIAEELTGDEVAQDVVDKSESLDSELKQLNQLLDLGSAVDYDDMGVLFGNASVKEIHALGKALESGKDAKVKKQLKAINDEYGLGIDVAALTDALDSLSTGAKKTLGACLVDMDADDLSEASSAFIEWSGSELSQDMADISNMFNTKEGRSELTKSIGGVIVVFIGIALVFSIITLIASAMAISNCRKPQKLGATFVMSIISAVLSLLTCSLISMVLYIIMAVYISKVRKAGNSPMGGAYNAAPESPVQGQ